MKRSFIILMAASALAALSCTKEVNDQTAPEKEQVTMSFDATIGAPTKVEIGSSATEGGVTTHKLNWSVEDKIKVYANEASSNEGVEFTTDITVPSATATFTGTIDADKTYYAFYPSSSNAKWYKSTSNFGFTIPTSQKPNGIASGFAMAKADNNGLQFDHVTGFVKFTIPAEYDGKIAKVTFAGNADEVLAGYVKVYPNDASQNEFPYDDTKYTEVNLLPSSGEAFPAGTYYMVVYPREFEQGITMTFTNTDGAKATKESSKSANVKAGDILNLGTITGLSYETNAVSLPWTEDFSGENPLDTYATANVTLYEEGEMYAGGSVPEILIGKNGGYLKAVIDLESYHGKLTLTYNANNATRIKLSSTEDDVTFSDIVANGKVLTCLITVPETVSILPLLFTNTSGDNVRVDNISLVQGGTEPQEIYFAKSSYVLLKGSSEASTFTGQVVNGAKTTVTYTSSNTSVATVNASTGAVTLVAPGETTITATAAETSDYSSATASYTIVYSAQDYVSLPWSFAGGTKTDLTSQVGITASGLGNDYAASHVNYRIKFDTTGDNVVIKTDSSIGVLKIGLKMLGGAESSSFTVSESSDGKSYTTLETLSWSGKQNDIKEVSTTKAFKSESRYLKFSFNKGSNIGLGPISITKAE